MTKTLRKFQNKIDHSKTTLWLNTIGNNPRALKALLWTAFLGNPIQSLFLWVLVVILSPQIGIYGALSASLGWVIYKSIKAKFKRPRPYERYTHIKAWSSPPDKYSFPSGHTLNAVVLSMTLCAINPFFAIAGFIWIFLTGVSRVALGLHYTSDVIMGGFLGVILGVIAIYLGLYI